MVAIRLAPNSCAPLWKMRATPIKFVALFLIGSLLQGCAGLKLYDPDKAKMVTGIKEQYSKVNAVDLIEIESRNLDKLLIEELDVVRKNKAIDLDFALLQIANNDTPMADTFIEGWGSIAALTKDPKVYLGAKIDIENNSKLVTLQRNNVEEAGNGQVRVPSCNESTTLLPPNELTSDIKDADTINIVQRRYKVYVDRCEKLRALVKNLSTAAGKKLADAEKESGNAASELQATKDASKSAEIALKKAKAAYDLAVKDAAGDSKLPSSKEVQEKTEHFLKMLNNLKENGVGADHAEAIDAIAQLLTAAATGKVDTNNPEMRRALLVAGRLPSLADDARAVMEKRAAPVVTNLLIAMRHQMVLAEHARLRLDFAEQRVALLSERHESYVEEARSLFNFLMSMCQFDHRKTNPNASKNRSECEKFRVVKKEERDSLPATIQCAIGETPLPQCALNKPWKAYVAEYRSGSLTGDAAREFHKALFHYVSALKQRVVGYEITFRLSDVSHRETLAAKKAALQSWDNLVAVPIEQLDAYYQSGLKPAEIADLIVKALGFTAIAIGVAR